MREMPDDIVSASIRLIQSKKGREIVILDLRGLTDVADYFILCSADSAIQVKAISDALVEGMKVEGYPPWHIEGYESLKWVLVDFVDVVVHIFQQEPRAFYGLERLWGDAPKIAIEEDEDIESDFSTASETTQVPSTSVMLGGGMEVC